MLQFDPNIHDFDARDVRRRDLHAYRAGHVGSVL